VLHNLINRLVDKKMLHTNRRRPVKKVPCCVSSILLKSTY